MCSGFGASATHAGWRSVLAKSPFGLAGAGSVPAKIPLGSGKGWEKLKRDTELGRSLGVEVTLWTPEQAKSHVPVLKEAEFEGAVWCDTDGIIDIHALLSGYLKAATAKGAHSLWQRS
jgi:glycine/D-amino acid oxidase-like deaminating enzyme